MSVGGKGLEIEDLAAAYDQQTVLDGVSLGLAPGDIGTLLGASGSGKSTLLRVIAGFEPARAGRILLDGRLLNDPVSREPSHRRGIGMVFQDHALFPHLDVAGNVGFGLRHLDHKQRQSRVGELLALIGLDGRAGAMPHELSGGQQQRVALARALAPQPRLLLMDEPFASLDRRLRGSLAAEVRSWLKTTGTTSLVVTHDVGEAFGLGDWLGVLEGGHLRQWDRPDTVWRQPWNLACAQLLGDVSPLAAEALGGHLARCALGGVKVSQDMAAGSRGLVLVRPGDLALDDTASLRGQVLRSRYHGQHLRLYVRLEDESVVALELPPRPPPADGQMVGLALQRQTLVMVAN